MELGAKAQVVNMLDRRQTFRDISDLWLNEITLYTKLFPGDIDNIANIQPAGAYAALWDGCLDSCRNRYTLISDCRRPTHILEIDAPLERQR